MSQNNTGEEFSPWVEVLIKLVFLLIKIAIVIVAFYTLPFIIGFLLFGWFLLRATVFSKRR